MELSIYDVSNALSAIAGDAALDLGIGVAIWALALLLPFRVLSARPEIGWDVAGYIGAGLATVAMARVVEDPLIENMFSLFPGWYAQFDGVPWWAALTVFIVVSDFGVYWAHRLLHTRALWASHAWHHSPKFLYFLSGTRGAPVHILVLTLPFTITYLVFPFPSVFYIALGHAVLQLANQHYLHSNLRFPCQHILETVLVTPRFHFVHHSHRPVYSNSNYGFIFSVWDRWFGTYTDPDIVPANEPLGLDYEISNVRALIGMPAATKG